MQLFFDIDGVYADFDTLAWEIFGIDPREYENMYGSEQFWTVLREWRSASGLTFFESLDLMPGILELWEATKHTKPIFLTGAPYQIPESQLFKQRWIRNRFGEAQPVITCGSKYKCTFAKPGDIIVDDWPKHRALWEAVGGIWVHHDDPKSTIIKLQKLGVI